MSNFHHIFCLDNGGDTFVGPCKKIAVNVTYKLYKDLFAPIESFNHVTFLFIYFGPYFIYLFLNGTNSYLCWKDADAVVLLMVKTGILRFCLVWLIETNFWGHCTSGPFCCQSWKILFPKAIIGIWIKKNSFLEIWPNMPP